jgi:predicted TPR repeat methyltransferase
LLLLLGAPAPVESAAGAAGFDLLVAADVFVYIGELLHVLKAAAAVAAERCVHSSS